MTTYERLDVEALSGHDGRDVLLTEGSENRGLSGVVEAEDEDSGLTLLFLEHAQLA